MLKNLNYDLTEEIAEKSKALWRYDRYNQDANSGSPTCDRCQQMWQQLKEQDEQQLNILKQELQNHVHDKIFA